MLMNLSSRTKVIIVLLTHKLALRLHSYQSYIATIFRKAIHMYISKLKVIYIHTMYQLLILTIKVIRTYHILEKLCTCIFVHRIVDTISYTEYHIYKVLLYPF